MRMNLEIKRSLTNIDIVTAFQEVAKLNMNALEDCGGGLYSVELPVFDGMSDAILQVYPNGEFNNVWCLMYEENETNGYMQISDFPYCVQKHILTKFIEVLELTQFVTF